MQAVLADLEKRMRTAAADLEFEEAARLRDEIRRLEQFDLGIGSPGTSPPGRSMGGRAGTSARQLAKHKARANMRRRRGP